MTDRPLGSRYTLGERMGSGGMGEVFRARNAEGEELAVKILRAQLAEDQELVSRFVQERSVMLSVRSPHVVQVRDMVVEGDTLAIVMELVRGRDLNVVKRAVGTFRPAEVARLGAEIARGMQAVHARGIVHRDLKPANVLLDETQSPPRPAVADFGVARICEDGDDNSVTVQAGTAAYMSPEQIRAQGLEPSSDVYSLGIMLYELLCGVTPFRGGFMDIVRLHQEAQPGRPEGIPDPLWDLLLSMVSKNPAQRPAMGAVTAELDRLRPLLEDIPAAPRLAAPPAPVPAAIAAGPDPTRVSAAPATGTAASQHPASPGAFSASPATAPTEPLSPHQAARSKRRWLIPVIAIIAVLALVTGIGGVMLYRGIAGGADEASEETTTQGAPSPSPSSTPEETASETPTEQEPSETPTQDPSAEPETMPDLVGEDATEIKDLLPRGTAVEVKQEPAEDDADIGLVMATDPAAGEEIDGPVTVTVGEARPTVLLSELEPIDSEGANLERETVTFGGVSKPNSLIVTPSSWSDEPSRTTYALSKKYDTLTFDMGIGDTDLNADTPRTIKVRLDRVEEGTYTATFNTITPVEIDVSDAVQIEIEYVTADGDDELPVYLGTPTLSRTGAADSTDAEG